MVIRIRSARRLPVIGLCLGGGPASQMRGRKGARQMKNLYFRNEERVFQSERARERIFPYEEGLPCHLG